MFAEAKEQLRNIYIAKNKAIKANPAERTSDVKLLTDLAGMGQEGISDTDKQVSVPFKKQAANSEQFEHLMRQMIKKLDSLEKF